MVAPSHFLGRPTSSFPSPFNSWDKTGGVFVPYRKQAWGRVQTPVVTLVSVTSDFQPTPFSSPSRTPCLEAGQTKLGTRIGQELLWLPGSLCRRAGPAHTCGCTQRTPRLLRMCEAASRGLPGCSGVRQGARQLDRGPRLAGPACQHLHGPKFTETSQPTPIPPRHTKQRDGRASLPRPPGSHLPTGGMLTVRPCPARPCPPAWASVLLWPPRGLWTGEVTAPSTPSSSIRYPLSEPGPIPMGPLLSHLRRPVTPAGWH